MVQAWPCQSTQSLGWLFADNFMECENFSTFNLNSDFACGAPSFLTVQVSSFLIPFFNGRMAGETTKEMMVKPGLPGWFSGSWDEIGDCFYPWAHELKKPWTDVLDHVSQLFKFKWIKVANLSTLYIYQIVLKGYLIQMRQFFQLSSGTKAPIPTCHIGAKTWQKHHPNRCCKKNHEQIHKKVSTQKIQEMPYKCTYICTIMYWIFTFKHICTLQNWLCAELQNPQTGFWKSSSHCEGAIRPWSFTQIHVPWLLLCQETWADPPRTSPTIKGWVRKNMIVIASQMLFTSKPMNDS